MDWKTEDYSLCCGASLVVFGYALRQRFDRLRQQYPNDFLGLDLIESDKTIRLLDKLWTNRDENSRKAKLFNFPVTDVNDKHGRRITFASILDGIPDPFSYDLPIQSVLDVMLKMDSLSTQAAQLLTVHTKQYPWGEVEFLEPRVTGLDVGKLEPQGFLCAEDIQFLDTFSKLAAALSKNQVITMGRHENADNTRDSILYEFNRWIIWTERCLELLASMVGRADDRLKTRFANSIWQCWSFARQCVRKAYEEHRIYATAATAFSESAQESGLKDLVTAFAKAQKSAPEIWESYKIQTLVFPSYYCWAFANYLIGSLRGLPSFKELLHRPNENAELEHSSYARLSYFNSIDPANRPMNFDPDRTDWESLGVRTEQKLVYPPDLWSGTVDMQAFIDVLQQTFKHIHEEYLDKDLLTWRRLDA